MTKYYIFEKWVAPHTYKKFVVGCSKCMEDDFICEITTEVNDLTSSHKCKNKQTLSIFKLIIQTYGKEKLVVYPDSDKDDEINNVCEFSSVPEGNVILYNATDDVSVNPSPVLVMVGIE